MRVTSTIVVFVAGVLLSVSVDRDSPPDAAQPWLLSALDAPAMTISSAPPQLTIAGTSSSAEHETTLQRLARDHFDDAELVVDFLPGVVVSGDWETVSNGLLRVVASMASAEARMTADNIEIRGVTADPGTTTARIGVLRDEMPASAGLSADIIVIRSAETLDELCRRSFTALVLGPISFARSSAELRPASFAAVDRITEFAHDCPSATIVIVLHTS